MFSAAILLQLIWTSIAGSTYQVLLTVAFSLTLKVLRIWDLSQSALMAIAFYAMYTCNMTFALPLVVGLVVAAFLTCVAAVAIERFGFRTLRGRRSEPIAFFIFTLILAEFISFALTLVFTTQPLFMSPDMMSPIWLVGGVVISAWDVTAVLVTSAVVAALAIFLRSRLGQYVVAVADNPDLAAVYGINPGVIYMLTMVVVALCITAATYIFGTKLALYPDLPAGVMIYAVAATILGGIGNVFLAAAAALVIGILQQFSVLIVDSRWQSLVVFAILFVAIVFFPRGIRLPQRRIMRPSVATLATQT